MSKQVIYAKFTARLLANMIDFLLLMMIVTPIANILFYLIFGNVAIDNMLSNIFQQAVVNGALSQEVAQNIMQNILNSGHVKQGTISLSQLFHFLASINFIDLLKSNHDFSVIMLKNLFTLILSSLMLCICWSYMKSSPGKFLLGLKIVDANNFSPINFKQSMIRSFAAIISGSVLMLGLIWILFNPRNQAWHDMMAGTLVIKR